MSADPVTIVALLLGIFGILLLLALLAACQYAIIRLRFSVFKDELASEEGQKGTIPKILDRADFYARLGDLAIVTGITVVALLLMELVQLLGGNHLVAITVTLLVAISVIYVLVALLPRSLGLLDPMRTLRRYGWMLRMGGGLVGFWVGLMNRIERLFLPPEREANHADLTELDIENQVKELESSNSQQTAVIAQIIRNALRIRELTVADILLPRNQVQIFDLRETNLENEAVAKRTRHTRFPLCEGSLDRCLGLIHVKDIFSSNLPIEEIDFRKIRREIGRTKLEDPLQVVLPRMLRQKAHMSLVVDEFGGVAGVVTLEQILEELVGDIQDEFDTEVADIQAVADDIYLVDGLAAIHDLEEIIEREIEAEDASTVSGLITSELGRLPEKEEELEVNGLQIAVTEVDDKRVLKARIRLVREEAEDSDSDNESNGR